ncbi:hypothetical protein [Streptomyces lancefieldiae]|uniref:Uncharacterized protein n=1 Tax=Streptomyces lancefieldiae TaxID=3075520 RepID=A0ABU3AF84_9ACTN|nr:hypothetical protein [Streptomyces sp. DSM 40712]MDT0608847.1 hypothetical protein [Streptomyces sp. DSM 40712]
MQYTHQTVRDFVAAMQRGDQAAAERIAHDISERHKRGTAAKGELSELAWANAATPLGRQ